MGRRRTVVLGAAVVLVVLVALGLLQRVGLSDRPDVLVIGDSVSYLSGGAIDDALGGERTDFAAKPGYTAAEIYPVALEVMARPGSPAAARDVVVILIGYNDVGTDAIDPEALDALLDLAEEFRCGVVFTLPARPGGQPATHPDVTTEGMERWNALLEERMADHPDLHLARDWQDAVESPLGSLLDADGLHPNEAGERALAEAYRRAIERACPSDVRRS
jgi:lysophospholipase L1-like esterase